MAMPTVSAVYIHVVEDVLCKVRDEFLASGVGDSVLNELQGLWEMKMLQCGAINGPIDRLGAVKNVVPTPVHDLNVPYEGPEEYETPTAEMLFPPTPLQTPIQTPLPGNIEQALYQLPTPNGPTDYASLQDTNAHADMKPGRPSPYMQPPSSNWLHQRPLGVDVNVAYEENREEGERGASSQPLTQDFFAGTSGKRKRDEYAQRYNHGGYIPQQDGSSDFKSTTIQNKNFGSSLSIPQQDGVHDSYDNIYHGPGHNEEYGTPAEHDNHIVSTPKPSKSEANEDDEPPLNEDDDDDDDLDDFDQGDDEPDTQHLVLAQFDKVTRTKSRWKCTLKDGIMHINSKDILFTKATGEFDF